MTKYKRITVDQWEGLQFELSEINSKLSELMGVQAPEEEKNDWGMDTKWQEREPQSVIPVDAPDGLEFGPFVLTTPEERKLILKNWDKKKEALASTQYELLDKIREIKKLEADLAESRQRYASLLLDIREADKTIEQLVDQVERKEQDYQVLGARLEQVMTREYPPSMLDRNDEVTWERMVEEGPE